MVPTREPLMLLERDQPLRPDFVLVIAYVVLSALGLLMIFTASAPRLEELGLDPAQEITRQALFVVIGFGAFAVASMIDVKNLRPWVPAIYIGCIVLLLLVLTPIGADVKGAQRWIPIGPLQFQPSEFAKLGVVLALATLLSAGPSPIRWITVARAIGIVALPAVLIFLQPDLGTMLVFGFIAIVMLFAGGAGWRQMTALGVGGLLGVIALFQVGAIKEYQLTRLTAFLDPTTDPLGARYNQLQSEIAIGTGGLTGKGLFEGTQTNLRFVPEQSNDFIFTAVGEQLGFLGALLVILLFALVLWRLLAAAVSARDRFGQLVTIGVASLIAFHVFVNIGMTVRLMPVTGLPLPFMSAGGTVFVAMSAALGLAHSVWLRRPMLPGERRRRRARES